MNALDPRDDERARGAPQKRAAGEVESRQRLPAALVEGAGAVGGAGASLEQLADLGVRLEALELLRGGGGGWGGGGGGGGGRKFVLFFCFGGGEKERESEFFVVCFSLSLSSLPPPPPPKKKKNLQLAW